MKKFLFVLFVALFAGAEAQKSLIPEGYVLMSRGKVSSITGYAISYMPPLADDSVFIYMNKEKKLNILFTRDTSGGKAIAPYALIPFYKAAVVVAHKEGETWQEGSWKFVDSISGMSSFQVVYIYLNNHKTGGNLVILYEISGAMHNILLGEMRLVEGAAPW